MLKSYFLGAPIVVLKFCKFDQSVIYMYALETEQQWTDLVCRDDSNLAKFVYHKASPSKLLPVFGINWQTDVTIIGQF